MVSLEDFSYLNTHTFICLIIFTLFRTARLQLTDELIDSLNVSSQAEEISKDMQKIQELLSLPPNKDESSQ